MKASELPNIMAPSHPTRWHRTKANLKPFIGAIALAMLIRIAIFEAFEIEGPSMEPTLLNGDRIVVSKFNYGLFLPLMTEALFNWGTPDLGDVIIVKSPADDRIDIVKRVVGLPGDLIQLRAGILYRNGKALPHRDLGPCDDSIERDIEGFDDCVWAEERFDSGAYRTSRSRFSPNKTTASARVPEGHVYVLGDHRDRSNDSRFFGPVPIARIKGKAVRVYFSRGSAAVRWQRIGEAVR